MSTPRRPSMTLALACLGILVIAIAMGGCEPAQPPAAPAAQAPQPSPPPAPADHAEPITSATAERRRFIEDHLHTAHAAMQYIEGELARLDNSRQKIEGFLADLGEDPGADRGRAALLQAMHGLRSLREDLDTRASEAFKMHVIAGAIGGTPADRLHIEQMLSSANSGAAEARRQAQSIVDNIRLAPDADAPTDAAPTSDPAIATVIAAQKLPPPVPAATGPLRILVLPFGNSSGITAERTLPPGDDAGPAVALLLDVYRIEPARALAVKLSRANPSLSVSGYEQIVGVTIEERGRIAEAANDALFARHLAGNRGYGIVIFGSVLALEAKPRGPAGEYNFAISARMEVVEVESGRSLHTAVADAELALPVRELRRGNGMTQPDIAAKLSAAVADRLASGLDPAVLDRTD